MDTKDKIRQIFNEQLALRNKTLHLLDNDTLADILNETFRLYLEQKKSITELELGK